MATATSDWEEVPQNISQQSDWEPVADSSSDWQPVNPAPAPTTISHERFPGMVSTTAGGTVGGGLNFQIPSAGELLPDAESVRDVYQDVIRPAVSLPKFTVNPQDSKTEAVLKSAANMAIGLPEFAESPLGIVTGGAATVIPRLVAAGFLADTGKSVVDQSGQLGSQWDSMTPGQRAAAVTDLGGSTVLAALMAHGATKLPVKEAAQIQDSANSDQASPIIPDQTFENTAPAEQASDWEPVKETDENSDSVETAPVKPNPINTSDFKPVRTPDGAVDHIHTALAKLREESKEADTALTGDPTPITVGERMPPVPPADSNVESTTPNVESQLPTIADKAAENPSATVTMADLASLEALIKGNQLKPETAKPPEINEDLESDQPSGKKSNTTINRQEFIENLKSDGYAESPSGGSQLRESWERLVVQGKSGSLAMPGNTRGINDSQITFNPQDKTATIHVSGYGSKPENDTEIQHESVTASFTKDGSLRMLATSGKEPRLLDFAVNNFIDLLNGNKSPETAKPAATAALPEQSLPRTYYHGTHSNFDQFKPFDEVPEESKDSSGQHTFGTYFSDSKEMASQFGKNIKTANLDISKPLDLTGVKSFDELASKLGVNTPENKFELRNIKSDGRMWDLTDGGFYRALEILNKKFEVVEAIKSKGHDAIVFPDMENGKKGNTTVIFDTKKISPVPDTTPAPLKATPASEAEPVQAASPGAGEQPFKVGDIGQTDMLGGGDLLSQPLKSKANQLADSLESLKTGIDKGGQLHAFGVPALIWDKAVGIAQAVIRAGGSIAEAISSAIAHIKENHKADFEEQKARFALMEKAQNEEQVKAGEAPPDRERSLAEVKSDAADAEANLKEATKPKEGQSKKDFQQKSAEAAARYRSVRDELKLHPDRIAEVLKETARLSKEASAAREAGDDAKARTLEDELQGHIDDLGRLPKKMVDRIQQELIDKGELPKQKEFHQTGAGRTLDRMTKFLKENDFDSPKATFAQRLALGKRFADTVSGVKDAVTKAGLKAQAGWKAMKAMFDGPPIDDDYRSALKSWIDYMNTTGFEESRYGDEFKKAVSQKVRRMGMAMWLDAGGDKNLLEFQRQSVPEKYLEIWETALKLTDGEKRIALEEKENWGVKEKDAVDLGLMKKGKEGIYVPQRWKVAPKTESDISGEKQGSAGNPYGLLDTRDPFFSFHRHTDSYFDGIMAGGEPENLDLGHLVTVYDAAFHQALGSRGWIKALESAKAKDDRPVVKLSGSASIKGGDTGATFVDANSLPKDAVTEDGRPYRAHDHPALKGWKFVAKDKAGNPVLVKGDMLIHPDHFDDVVNQLETPRWMTKNAQGFLEKSANKALRASAFLKSSKFIGPFHIVTEALHAAFHGVVPSTHGFEIDLKDPKQSILARNMTLGYGHAREMFEEGLGSHGGIWAKVPGLGDAVVRMNNFTFNEYIPKLKMKVGLAVLDRNIARYSKDLNQEQIAELTGRQMDAAFGGQNWRLMGANKNLLGVLRLGLVAPDFLISRAKVIGQAFKPYNNEQRIFLAAQVAGVYVIARTLNAIFSDDHDPHFELKNWDSVVIGKRAYHARFIVSDAANLARDLLGLGSFNQHSIPFITGRLGVAPKIVTEAVTGKDLFTGQNKEGLFNTENPLLKAFSIVAKDVAEWMTPMGVDGFMPGAASKGQTGIGSAIAATVGVTSKKESAANEIWDLARNFNKNSSDPKAVNFQKRRDNESGTPIDYRALNNLLDAGELDKSKQELDALKATGKTDKQILDHYDRNVFFTGNSALETKFIASLTPAQKITYRAAKAEQAARAQALKRALSRTGGS